MKIAGPDPPVVWGCVQGFLTAKKFFFRTFFEIFFDFFLAFFESSFASKKIQIEKKISEDFHAFQKPLSIAHFFAFF